LTTQPPVLSSLIDEKSPLIRESIQARTIVLITIVATAIARLILAATLGLGIDESYVVSVARPLSLSYFDHPPLHFWIAAAAQFVAGSPPAGPLSGLVLRAPFVLLFALTTWILARLTARLFGERAALYAALALNTSAVFSLSTGSWVLPDGPLMYCSVATVYAVTRALYNGPAPASVSAHQPASGAWRWWLAAGVTTGLAMLSKYHGVLLLAGVFTYLATTPQHRRWLAHPAPYVAALIAALIFTPVLVWNTHHGWVSFRFQADRGAPQHGLHLAALARNIAGQAAWVLPWIWIPLVVVLARALRRGPADPHRWLLANLGLWPIALFTLISLGGNPGLPHWPALGYLMLFPLLGAALADHPAPRWLTISGATLAAVTVIAATQATTGWLSRVIPALSGPNDPTLDLVDWRDLRQTIATRGLLQPGRFVAATSWIQAGKTAYALGPGIPVLCLSNAPHQFWYQYDESAFVGHDALLVIREPPRGGGTAPLVARYATYFRSIEPLGPVAITRLNGAPALTVDLYLARTFEQPFPTAQPR
jgi:4-amino-4-deoxy-L-arabinose transferase-like glycosyltransferase